MRFTKTAALLAAVVLTLAGCATAPPEIPYDRTTSGTVHTIGVLSEGYPTGPSAILAANIGAGFGLIGGITESIMRSNRESSLRDIMASQNFRFEDEFNGTLVASLAAKGYQVVTVPVTRENGKQLDKYPDQFGVAADAYLDIAVYGYGYIAAAIADSAPYRPFMSARVRLIRASDKSVLMQDIVIYNPYNNPKNAVTISADPAYSYTTFDLLEGDRTGTVTGLKLAADQSADAVANLLR
jgi:hypothetical protein